MSDHLTGDERAEFLSDARDLIDWLMARPAVPVHRYARMDMTVYESWVEDVQYDEQWNPIPVVNPTFPPIVVARAMGKADKVVGHNFELRRRFGQHSYAFSYPREGVCSKRTVGTKPVQKLVATDQDRIHALKAEIDSLYETVTEQEPIIEYDCPKSLLSDAA